MLEPVALGMVAAPSWSGVALGVAVMALFFARRPMRLAWLETKPERRHRAVVATVTCGAIAVVALAAAVMWAGNIRWLGWLLPTVVMGLVFLGFDLQRQSRESSAELAGTIAFAWLPAVFAAVASWPNVAAIALATVALARLVPTVITVRTLVRSRKTGEPAQVWPVGLAVFALTAVYLLYVMSWAPALAVIGLAVLVVRSFVLLISPRPALRASQLGVIEAVLGGVFVVVIGFTWQP